MTSFASASVSKVSALCISVVIWYGPLWDVTNFIEFPYPVAMAILMVYSRIG